jgi:hypothetical protein
MVPMMFGIITALPAVKQQAHPLRRVGSCIAPFDINSSSA